MGSVALGEGPYLLGEIFNITVGSIDHFIFQSLILADEYGRPKFGYNFRIQLCCHSSEERFRERLSKPQLVQADPAFLCIHDSKVMGDSNKVACCHGIAIEDAHRGQ